MIQIINQTKTIAKLAKANRGEVFIYRGKEYRVEAIEVYTNAIGREAMIVEVSTSCEVCGIRFHFRTRRNPHWLPKSCGRYHQPKAKADDKSRKPLQDSPLYGSLEAKSFFPTPHADNAEK